MPPRELPGFYFDVERNRYFPLSSRPPPSPSVSTSLSQVQKQHDQPSQRRRTLWNYPASKTTSAGRAREASVLLHGRLAATSRGCSESVRWPFSGARRVCAFRTTPTHQFMGDSYGWLYSRTRTETSSEMDPCDDIEQLEAWIPDLSLAVHSEISALCTTETLRVGVCFGPVTKICVQDVGVPGRTQLLHLSAVHDVRAASLQGRALVLGAADNVVFLADLDASDHTAVRMLPTRSDVFTVAQHENLIYAGTRAGNVLRFDTRLNAKGSAQVLFESGPRNDNTGSFNRANPQPRSSVVFVQPIHAVQQLVVGYMDGRLGTYDLRFPRPTAQYAVTYAGNPSSLSCNGRLGITLDPSERFLFAAGADHRLRAWALDSGAPVASSASPSPSPSPYAPSTSRTAVDGDSSHNPFTMRFATDFSALQVVDADDGPGQVLWASGGSEVWRWRLGV
ncbi:hypothetical protein DFH08DRAFT_836765 [Mycena albidolilacea]|uniref:WD40 repeat-like protein n=1 Tax=Mycena albidolilacea TaxID=1033008 RepID=A0AAD7F588_9AGAR|nr:hypothetical protein DFH08DRAFT_836765 [Mycena albidolilacea]